MKVELTKDWCTNMARLEDDASERWSVDDVLLVVSTYGPWGADLNGVHKQEIILADEVLRLRESEKALVATLRDEMDEGLRLRDEWETRADGVRVRKDRWEGAVRRIVALLWGNHQAFEIDEVVDAVRALVPKPHAEGDDEALVRAVQSVYGPNAR